MAQQNPSKSVALKTSTNPAKRQQAEAKKEVFKTWATPEGPKLNSLQGRIKELMAKAIRTPQDACELPDEISISYTFNFPEAAEEFRSFFRGDFEVFSTNVFDRANARTQVATRGLALYSLRCPFLACAFCIRLDVDSYMYTIPAIVAPLRSDPTTGFTPANDGAAPSSESNPFAADQQNAVFDFGTVSNRIAYYLFNFYGVRIELGCNDLVTDKRLSYAGFEVNSHLGICANTNVDTTEDLANANAALTRLPEDSVFANKQVYAPNADPCCGESGAPRLAQSPITSASSGSYQYTGQLSGCIPLPKVPIMAGMGIEATIYTLPGQEDKRDEMLQMVTSALINPSLSNPNVLVKSKAVTYKGATVLNIVGECGNVVGIAPGERVPADLITVSDTNEVHARWGHAWFGSTYVDSHTTPVGANGPFVAGGTAITAADLDVEDISTSIGSAEQYRIRAGKLVLTFALKGAYMSWDELVEYLQSIASKNKRLATLYTSQTAILQEILQNGSTLGKGNAGVAGIEELRDTILNPKTKG